MRKAQQGIIFSVLARSAPGPAGASAMARYTSRYRTSVAPPQKPVELVNSGEAVNFPLLFSALLVLFGAATMVHLLPVSVRRRRTEAGLLKVLGLRQDPRDRDLGERRIMAPGDPIDDGQDRLVARHRPGREARVS